MYFFHVYQCLFVWLKLYSDVFYRCDPCLCICMIDQFQENVYYDNFRKTCKVQMYLCRSQVLCTVQITFIFIGQTHLVFGKRVCTCATKHSNAFRTFLNWLKNSKRVWHQPKLHILRLSIFANFDL